jgi:SAM-dependent methyltransferase
LKPSSVMRPLLRDGRGNRTALLNARVSLTKFAATRGWVIPFLTVRSGIADKWRTAQKDDGIGYQHYIELEEDSKVLLSEITSCAKPQDRVLDLGCNVGRELNHLWELGFRDLTGVEIGEAPVRAMKEVFPEMAGGSRIINRSMTEAIVEFGDAEFDLVYAHGSLVSLSAREQFVFDEMVRVTRCLIVTLENEWSGMLFPRDFGRVFTSRGMTQVLEREVRVSAPENGRQKKSMLRIFKKHP